MIQGAGFPNIPFCKFLEFQHLHQPQNVTIRLIYAAAGLTWIFWHLVILTKNFRLEISLAEKAFYRTTQNDANTLYQRQSAASTRSPGNAEPPPAGTWPRQYSSYSPPGDESADCWTSRPSFSGTHG